MHTLAVHAHSRYPWLNSPWGYMWTQFALPIKLLTFAPECNTWFCTVLSCKAIITQAAPWCEMEEAVTSCPWETLKSAELFMYFFHHSSSYYYLDTCVQKYLSYSWKLQPRQLLWPYSSPGAEVEAGSLFCLLTCTSHCGCHLCAKLQESMSHNRSCYVKGEKVWWDQRKFVLWMWRQLSKNKPLCSYNHSCPQVIFLTVPGCTGYTDGILFLASFFQGRKAATVRVRLGTTHSDSEWEPFQKWVEALSIFHTSTNTWLACLIRWLDKLQECYFFHFFTDGEKEMTCVCAACAIRASLIGPLLYTVCKISKQLCNI